MEKGNTTVYEWRKGEAPVEVEAIPFDLSIRLEDDEEEKQEQIEVSEEVTKKHFPCFFFLSFQSDHTSPKFSFMYIFQIDWGQLDSVEDVIDFDISVEDGGQEVWNLYSSFDFTHLSLVKKKSLESIIDILSGISGSVCAVSCNFS